MALTDKQKRAIVSPDSFSPGRLRLQKLRTRRKIDGILNDVRFLVENAEMILKRLDLDVIAEINDKIKTERDNNHTGGQKSEIPTDDDDPDFL